MGLSSVSGGVLSCPLIGPVLMVLVVGGSGRFRRLVVVLVAVAVALVSTREMVLSVPPTAAMIVSTPIRQATKP